MKFATKIGYKYLYLFHTTFACRKQINMVAMRNTYSVSNISEIQ